MKKNNVYRDGKTVIRKGDVFACSKGNLELMEILPGTVTAEIGGRPLGQRSRKDLYWFFVDDCDFVTRKSLKDKNKQVY